MIALKKKLPLLVLLIAALAGPAHSADVLPAEDFVDSIAVNTHMRYGDTPYRNLPQVIQALKYLGIDHIRDSPPRLESPRLNAIYESLANYGIKFDFIVQGGIPSAIAAMRQLVDKHPGSIAAIEGPNEINNQKLEYAGLTGVEAGARFQADLYKAVKSDPKLSAIPVYNFTGYEGRNGQADFTNMHPYPRNNTQPYATLRREIETHSVFAPGRPLVFTESGYYSLPGPVGWGGFDEETHAKLLLNLLFDATLLNVKRTYIYELFDERPDPQLTQQEAHFGFFDTNYRAKRAAFAVRNLILILKAGDKARSPETTPPEYRLEGLPETAKHLLLTGKDGWSFVALWNEPKIWNKGSFKPLPIDDRTVMLKLGAPRKKVVLYNVMLGSSAFKVFTNISEADITLNDTLVLIGIGPE